MTLPTEIMRRWPLPQAEARALGDFVRRARARVRAGRMPVRVTPDGRFRAHLEADEAGGRFQAPRGWTLVQRGKMLELTTVARFGALVGNRSLSQDDMALLGLGTRPRDAVLARCCAGLADAIRQRNTHSVEDVVGRIFGVRREDAHTLYAAVGNGVLTDANRPRPPFQAVWNAFKKQGLNSSEHIADIIGGKVWVNANLKSDTHRWKNFCTVRISYALNQAGFRLPYIVNQTSSGRDTEEGKKWHFFRVNELGEYLSQIWGSADISVVGPVGSLTLDKIRGNQGILLFNMPGGSGWTGHATLWDGRYTRDDTAHYAADADGLQLWILL